MIIELDGISKMIGLKKTQKFISYAITVLVLIWAIDGINISINKFESGIPEIFNYFRKMLPPDYSIFPRLVDKIANNFFEGSPPTLV